MPASHSPALASQPSATPHFHVDSDTCPLCDQPIPSDRADEIRERIEAREADITNRLSEQYERESARALEQVRAEAAAALDREQAATVEKLDAARAEERQLAQDAAQERVVEADRARKAAEDALLTAAEQAAAIKADSDRSRQALEAQIAEVNSNHVLAIQELKRESAVNEASIRADALRVAEAAVQAKLTSLELSREESETALKGQIELAQTAKATAEQAALALTTTIERMTTEAAAREATIRQETMAAAEAQLQQQLTETSQARLDAEAKLAIAEQLARETEASFEVKLAAGLQEQRDALQAAQIMAVNAEKSAAFEEKQKLQTKLDDLQRAFDNKTAEELGEGAEIDLFESLKAAFEGDRIERVNKGQPGADILHTVFHNGKECGKIIYDSKNHGAWRTDFVTKLAADKLAAKADHAILSTRKFPANTRQLHEQDGILIASPARAVTLVGIVRQHMVQSHTLRMSNEARVQKTAALYEFIISERCADLFTRIDTQAEALLEVQVKERRAHDAVWKKQGELIRNVQKVNAEISHEIHTIIGTAAEAAERAS